MNEFEVKLLHLKIFVTKFIILFDGPKDCLKKFLKYS
jgi:hypothetical protein